MEVQIKSVGENPLLNRRQVELKVQHGGESTPSREDIKSRFAAEKTLNKDVIEVGTINTGYGSNTSNTELKVYEEFEYSDNLEKTEQDQEASQVTEEHRNIVSGTITDAKDEIGDIDSPDYSALIQAEKEDKNRTTFIDWLETQAK